MLEVRFGTKITMFFENDIKIEVDFFDCISPVIFFISCEEIANNIDEFKGKEFTATFFAWKDKYTFTGKIAGVRPDTENIVSCTATSFIEIIALRADVRINVNLKVKIYSHAGSSPAEAAIGSFICEAISYNISKGGICLWFDENLSSPLNTTYCLEISPFLKSTYILPAKMVRRQMNTTTRIYVYDYGFAFSPEAKHQSEKLILDIMELGMNTLQFQNG